MYPLALEGALKLKEISYIHAEGYAAGELKHGPIALIDEDVPVIVLAPLRRRSSTRPSSNMQEVMARGGKVLLLSDAQRHRSAPGTAPGGRWRCRPPIPSSRRSLYAAAGAAPRLPRRRAQGHRRRPAAQPREVRDGGMTPLAVLEALADPARAAEARAYHKADRRYLGIALPAVETLVADWRAGADVPARVALAHELWATDVHEARIAAAKLLTQARIGDGEPLVWAELSAWVHDFDAWAVADHACKAIERRLVAAPERIDRVEDWTTSPTMWVRRAALVATLPWSKLTHPTAADLAVRERVLGWAAAYVPTATGSSRKPSAGG